MTHPSLPATTDLATSPDRYQALVDSVRDYAIFMLDTRGHVISWNPGAQAIKGYAAHEIIGSHFSRFYPTEALNRKLPEHELTVAAATGRFEDEGWRLRKDGSRFWANVVITRMLDPAGRHIGYSKVTRDLTERRNQELKLRESEERFRSLVAGVKDYAIFMLDINGVVTTWNLGAQQIKGYSAEEIIGSHFSRFYPPEAIKRRLPEIELHGATMQGRYEDEGWRLRKDGSRFWANVIITALRDASGRLTGFSKITRNLTERREHEEALRQSEERLRLLVEGVTDYALVMLDCDGSVVSWNNGARRIKGYESHEILGRHISHFYPSEAIVAGKPWEDLTIARTRGRVSSEGWRVRKDGALFWASSAISALRDGHDNLYGFASVTQDLTGRRHAEELADTAQRMHEFIAMLAHELRNPLAPIRNAVALMGRKGLKDPTLESMRQTIDRQSVQLTRLLDELLDVNRIARGSFAVNREPLDLREVIARALESSRPLIESREHTVEMNFTAEPLPSLGDGVRLIQALANLLNNAAKYTPQAGKITLGATIRGADVEINVSDNGRGIAPEMLEKVFDLFVQVDALSSDAVGGLGVGLALVRRVVELHGGTVTARSQGLGLGSEFSVRLPLSRQPLQIVASAIVQGAALPQLRVLVVDDNQDAADTLELLLRSMGQQVRAVYDSPSAVTIARAFNPHLILLDIGMPLMSGYEVARAISALGLPANPALVAITGWGQDTDRRRADEAGFQHHFVKPMDEGDLRAILEQVAGNRRE